MRVPKALTRKVGPLPVWALLLVGAAAGFYLYRRHKSSTSSAAAQDQSSSLTGATYVPTGDTSGIAAAQAGQPSTATAPAQSLDTDTLTNLLGPDSALVLALDQLVGSGANYGTPPDGSAAGYPNPAPSATVPTPGATTGGVTPTTTVVQIQVPPGSKVSSTPTKPAAKSTSAPALHYYTYKKQVPLKAGQTVHFTSGKGYYAA